MKILVLPSIADVALSICSEMIFQIPKIISFLSQGTTLERGTIIMTGTGPGIGCMRTPKVVLNHGDDIRVEIERIGTLVNKIYYE
jgi:2-keto-4-pentenoate hydratase/2-oxohepta-3-ene-1,7-dioic acid hydratase in catechol pathway